MDDERYSLEVGNDYVLIYGELSIREAFDFLSFFDQQGFKYFTCGHENSTLLLKKETEAELKKEISENKSQMYFNILTEKNEE